MFSDLSPHSDGEILNSSDSSISISSSSSSSSSSDGSTVISVDFASCHCPSEPSSFTAKDFKLIRRIGSGDIGNVYLCRLREDHRRPAKGEREMFAMKVVDKEMVRRKKKKMERTETEKRVMKKLNHPFLPTVFADFDASPDYSCLVMEYCSGGDLHSLRNRQPASRFSLDAARFYAAEVLLALEYLHMMGIVYRDLKPENVLIRSDGHVMLSDFDLSLEATSEPTVEPVGPPAVPRGGCFPIGRLFRSRQAGVECRFVAEPVDARSNSFVGTHEYVAPEVASGGAHGSAVDWWAYGVFLYELLFGKTPFVGPTNEATLKNIIKNPLSFPARSDAHARDLIASLLAKDPSARLGSSRGASDVKAHPFFKGVNFALLRSCRPPVVPGPGRSVSTRKPERFDFF